MYFFYKVHIANYDIFLKFGNYVVYRNLSLGLTTKAKVCKGVSQKWSPGITFHDPESVGKREGMNPTFPVGVSMESQIFRGQSQGSKLIWLKISLYHWKYFRNQMSKMGLHDPFGHLKHKLWPEEGPRVKLPIWPPTAKSQESPWFPCVQVACNIMLKSSWWGLKLFFGPHLNQRSAHKIMGLQSHKSPNLGNFGTPTWESRDKTTFGCWPMTEHKKYYKGEGGGFPQVQAMVSLGSSCLPMDGNYALTNLFVWFVQVHVSNWFSCHSS
jgi:hypothetical protein